MDNPRAFLLGLLLFLDVALDQSLGIRCFDCNSYHDPRCGDPFDKDVAAMALVDCQQFDPSQNFTMCRKIVQKVDGQLRTKRGCGWYGDAHAQHAKGCIMKAGTFEVQLLYCTCVKDGCNSAHSLLPSSRAAILIPLLLAASAVL